MTQLKTKTVHFLVFQQFYLNFAVFFKTYKKPKFTEFYSLLKENYEEKSYVLPL